MGFWKTLLNGCCISKHFFFSKKYNYMSIHSNEYTKGCDDKRVIE